MKKFIVLASFLAATLAQAEGLYTGVTYDQKDKQNSAQVNHVVGVNVGQKFANGVTVEGRMENERVAVGDGTQKQEGLMQAKVSYDIATGTMFTPYVAAAIGQKNKAQLTLHTGLVKLASRPKSMTHLVFAMAGVNVPRLTTTQPTAMTPKSTLLLLLQT